MLTKKKLPYGSLVTLPLEKSPLDNLLFEKDDESGILRRNNEVGLLLNVKYLEQRIGPDNVREYLRNNQPHKSQALAGVSDDDLLRYCKSRGVQTLSDLSHYAESICRCAQGLRDYSDHLKRGK